MSEFVGPALPPGFQQDSPESPPETSSYGPSLPPSTSPPLSSLEVQTSSYGPSPPPSTSPPLSSLEVQTRAEPSGYGPSLPPLFEDDSVSEEDNDGRNVLGPALPPWFGGSKERGDVAGPMLPPGYEGNIEEEEEEEDSVIGPLPAHKTEGDEERARIRKQFESRSKAMKDKLTGKDKEGEGEAQREGWMLELPKKFKPSGVGPRKFRTGVTDLGDRSVWTDTPADKLRKAMKVQEKGAKKETKEVQKSARDKKLEVLVNDHNEKNRPASLMSMHRKRRADDLKGRDGGSGGVKERRPFDRDIDLEVRPNLVTPAKRKALMKDSKYSLDSKFTHGSSSFL